MKEVFFSYFISTNVFFILLEQTTLMPAQKYESVDALREFNSLHLPNEQLFNASKIEALLHIMMLQISINVHALFVSSACTFNISH